MPLLDSVNSPADLRKIPRKDLPALAEEIRAEMIRVCARQGGHLAPSLGVVELSIVLHAIFDTPEDWIVWDIGHQAYAHKILTGRRAAFETIRQWGGISGFLRRDESPFDVFGAGHSSTSISSALGLACARDLKKEARRIVAVIGDGAMTAGMAFEALNNAGHLKKDLIVVLNDNEMSISPNVGAFSAYLSRLMTGPFYTTVRKETEHFLKAIPRLGLPMIRMAKTMEEGVKGMVGPGILFEEMGFQYVGPLDGNDLDVLFATMENVKRLSGPTLVHVVTKKGKGYKPAEDAPGPFHGTPPFEIATGKRASSSGPTYTGVFGQAMVDLARQDQSIVAITAAMADGTGLAPFSREFPERFFDVGIAEQHGVTFAAGLAAGGLKPVVAVYSTFLQRAYDQIVHDVCLQNLPVVFALDRAGLVGEDGPTHHGAFDLAYLRVLPNMIVMSPKDENEFRRLLKTAVDHPGPAAVRYPRGAAAGVPLDPTIQPLPVGSWEVLREGREGTILAVGPAVQAAMEAAETLAAEGHAVGVVNARFVKPLDENLLKEMAREGTFWLTVEDHQLAGGFGSAVLEFLETAPMYRGVRVKRVGLPDRFSEHGEIDLLRRAYGLDAEGIAAAVRSMLSVRTIQWHEAVP